MRLMSYALAALGTGVAVFLLFFFVLQGITFLGDASERSLDMSQRLRADLEGPGPSVPPFVFVDIDRTLYAELNYPPIMPREKLATAARLIVESEPALLFIDIDLGWRAPDKANQAFVSFLEFAAQSSTHVLLLRNGVAAPDKYSPPTFRPTPFDGIVSRSGNLHWVIAETLISGDGVARRAPLYRAGCYRGKSVVVPGASFLAYALLSDSNAGFAQSIQAALAAYTKSCPDEEGPDPTEIKLRKEQAVSIGSANFAISEDHLSHRINYSMRWPLPEGQKRPTVTLDQKEVPLLFTISAQPLFQSPDTTSRRLFNGRVVIIGSSAPDARDQYLVPLGGMMPGAIIVANHIRSLLEHGVDEQFGFWFALALSALFSLVTFTGWWFIRDFLGRHPILGGELFKIGAVVVWFAVIVYFSTPAVAVGFVVVQYFVAAVLIVLSFYDKRVARSTQESNV